MILCQNRETIEQTGKRIYTLKVGDKYQVLNKVKDDEVTVLGEYNFPGHAARVLKDIFQYIRTKKDTYCMPDKDNK